MRRYLVFITFVAISFKAYAGNGDASPTFQLSGDVSLLSHYVENGLSQSNHSPALQGSFWFNFGPQFRLGLWGSNTNYENSDDHFNLRFNGDIKVDFSSNVNAILGYSHSQFYNGGDRNGSIISLDINFWNYRVTYDKYSNWEGTELESSRFAFGALFPVFGNWQWDNEIGYNTPALSALTPYFDGWTALGVRWGTLLIEGAVTGTSNSSQFNGRGEYFFILSAKKDL